MFGESELWKRLEQYRLLAPKRRPINLRAWARPVGLTMVLFTYPEIIERDWLSAAGLAIGGIALIAWSLTAPVEPQYTSHFPYCYIGDMTLEQTEVLEHDVWSGRKRLLRAVILVLLLAGVWLISDPTPHAVANLVIPAGVVGLWAYEMPFRASATTIFAAVSIGMLVGLGGVVLGYAISAMFQTSGYELHVGFIAFMVAASFVYVGHALVQAFRHYPRQLVR